MRKKNKARSASDNNSSYSASDSSNTSDSTGKKVTQRKKRGRPPKTNKRQKLQDDSSDDEPQPSTSCVRSDVEDLNESDPGSSTPDSDYAPVKDKSLIKKKTIQKKRGSNTSDTSKQKKRSSDGNSTRASQKNGPNVSNKKLGKSPNCNGNVVDPKIIESLAQKCVYFLLVEDQKKYAIRKKAIVTHVFKDDIYSSKLYLAVINKANNILQKTFGMELMELENQKDSYLIINILKRELGIHDYFEMSRLKEQQYGLITYLLTVIYMNDNVITEDELTKALKPLEIDLTSKRIHPVFGDVKKFITTELVKQMYLNYVCITKEPPNYEFTWGLRAKQEFDKRDLLQFACKVMGMEPEDWKVQFRDAEKSSRESPDD